MFAGQTVTFLPCVSKGVGGEENLFSPPIILSGTGYSPEPNNTLHFTFTPPYIMKWFLSTGTLLLAHLHDLNSIKQ
jgi:hypothetical protein